MMQSKKTIAFHTLGCKLNFSETDTISRKFADGKYSLVPFNEAADIYVINSCTVTKNAEKRCRELIKKAMKANPEAHVAVIGCYSEISPEELAAIPGVAMVLGNKDKYALHEYLESIENNKNVAQALNDNPQAPASFIPSFSLDGRTRSFFKIQDGCDYKCAYCTIPLARGQSRSNNIVKTLETAREIANSDIREVVLTGVNIGDFGKPHGETFFDLIKKLVKTDGLDRIRLSSVEPDLLTDDIIRLVADEEKLMPHFHIPLQSGSDAILKKMGRRYDTKLFTDRVKSIRRQIPHACIAADLIVGYPDETASLFEESLQFISGADVSYIHVFTYSERENTRAVKSSETVHPIERKQRSKQMQMLSAVKKKAFLTSNKGLQTKVLWEKDETCGFMYGFSENYIKVKSNFDIKKVNTIELVVLNKQDNKGVYIV
jgi:threonylcarbamoyladenosine tRNA methylthiotransferase MtaB